MKNFLLLIHDDAGQEARLQAELDITRALGGHLKCVDVPPLTVIAKVDPKSESATTILLAEVDSGRFDYLVMGGFGHRRFVEALFGGVTRRMLTKSPVPVFLAH
jgi:nucleotide-binding universal stress UspA family protein